MPSAPSFALTVPPPHRFVAAFRSRRQAKPHTRPPGRQNHAPAALTGLICDKNLPESPKPPGGAGKRVRTSFHSLNRGSFRSGKGSCAIERISKTSDSASAFEDLPV